MALFTIADLHLSFSVEKPMDVFGADWKNYTEKISEYWKYMVSDADTVVLPGDISWATTLAEAKEDFAFIEALPGKKIILKGNHDYWWNSMAKLNGFLAENGFSSIHFLHNNAYLAEGKVICGSRGWMCDEKMTDEDLKILQREAIRIKLSIDEGKRLAAQEMKLHGIEPEIICFSHFPVVTPAQRENPILEVLVDSGIRRVYFGHLHNWGQKPLIETEKNISFILVSSDYRNFTPVRIDS